MERVIGLNKAQLGIMLILGLNSCFKNSKTRAKIFTRVMIFFSIFLL